MTTPKEEKKCRKCKILERKILQLADKYEKLVTYSMRGKTIDDVDRTLAENKVIEVFRENGVFGFQKLEKIDKTNTFISGGVSQSFNIIKAQEIINNPVKYFR